MQASTSGLNSRGCRSSSRPSTLHMTQNIYRQWNPGESTMGVTRADLMTAIAP